jgi:phospholipid/cholesterol/gamma-HCH transport system substrate-binding protein
MKVPRDRETEEPEPEEPLPSPAARVSHREVWVGVFVIVGIIAVAALLLVMTSPALIRGRYVIKTVVPNAGGIRRSDPVQMRGVNVGRVLRFKMIPEGVEIRMEIEGDYSIPTDSYLELKGAGLLGGMVADIVPGKASEVLHNGDVIQGRTSEGMVDVSNRLAKQAETVLNRMEQLLSKETIDNVHSSSGELDSLLKQLNGTVGEQRRELMTLTKSLQRSSAGFERTINAPELEAGVKRVDAITKNADEAAKKMTEVSDSLGRSSKAMEDVMARIQRGEGSLGRATRDDKLYDNLSQAAASINEASVNLNKLADDLRKNPKKYINLKVF